jgi:dihydroorotase
MGNYLWIRGGTVVFERGVDAADLVVHEGRIVGIGERGPLGSDEIDATGLHVFAGVIDDQVHFREPGLTWKEDLQTASRACAKGGVTTFLEMPNTVPNAIDQQRIDEKLALASQKSLVDFGFYIGATPANVQALRSAVRTPGIKIFIGSSTGDLLVDDQAALEAIFAETTLPICAHCEDESTIRANAERIGPTTDLHDHSRIRDEAAAVIATKRAIALAKKYRHPFHVLHVSTGAELPFIADHDHIITAEACPHHLLFHTGDYARLGTRVQMNPSIKEAADNEALWQGLRDGTIQVIATDHAPHTLEEKAKPYPTSPSGLPAVENSLVLMLRSALEGRCSLSEISRWMSANPARVWNIVDKGRIEVGYHADLVLVDLHRPQLLLDENQVTKSRWTPWHGEQVPSTVVRTLVRGQTVYHEGSFAPSPLGRPAEYAPERGGYYGTLRPR